MTTHSLLDNGSATEDNNAIRVNGRGQANWLGSTVLLCDKRSATDEITKTVNNPGSEFASSASIDNNIAVVESFGALGGSPAPDYSIGGVTGFQNLKFESDATASIAAVDSSSHVLHGVERLTFFREN